MIFNRKENHSTKIGSLLEKQAAGWMAMKEDPFKVCFLGIYIIGFSFIFYQRKAVFHTNSFGIFAKMADSLSVIILGFFGILGLFITIAAIGLPMNRRRIERELGRCGFYNSARETPILLSDRKDGKNPNVRIFEFDCVGIPLKDWDADKEMIEAALNISIVGLKYGRNRRKILVYYVSGEQLLPDIVYWDDKYFDEKTLVLGLNYEGLIKIDLEKTHPLLIGGNSGSGKSNLMLLLLMQALRQGTTVYIVDFKGGVDYSRSWRERCIFCFDREQTLAVLLELERILEERKAKIAALGCHNAERYFAITGIYMERIIFSCDEVAAMLNKVGCSKEEKAKIELIEAKMELLIQQGRAVSISLFLATQRPDHIVLSGQIRSNITCKICGRADRNLSQLILDSSEAAERVPKDAQGRFVMNDGTEFQAFYFDEEVE